MITYFTVLAKSNNILIGNYISTKNRVTFYQTIIRYRGMYQTLVKCVAKSYNVDKRCYNYLAWVAASRTISITLYMDEIEKI